MPTRIRATQSTTMSATILRLLGRAALERVCHDRSPCSAVAPSCCGPLAGAHD
jgi:hypothetical protein